MADYPTTIPWVEGTKIQRTRGHLVDRAMDGTAYVRRQYSSDKRQFEVRHVLTSSQRTTLLNFYNDRMTDEASFNLYIPGDGTPAVVKFIDAIDGIDVQSPKVGLGYEVVVKMLEM